MDASSSLAALTPERRVAVQRQALADLYRESLHHLCKFGLGYKDVNRRTHGKIVRALESPRRRKMVCVPRGSLKSSIAVVGYSIRALIRNPNVRILIDSELYSNSTTFLREIKAHLVGPNLSSIFGNPVGSLWNEGEITTAWRTQPKREASITCGGIGTTKVGQHYDIIIGDDFNSPKNTGTPEGRKKVIDHIRHNISILEPDGVLVFTATRYHEEDTTGFVLRDLMGITVEQALAISKAA